MKCISKYFQVKPKAIIKLNFNFKKNTLQDMLHPCFNSIFLGVPPFFYLLLFPLSPSTKNIPKENSKKKEETGTIFLSQLMKNGPKKKPLEILTRKDKMM